MAAEHLATISLGPLVTMPPGNFSIDEVCSMQFLWLKVDLREKRKEGRKGWKKERRNEMRDPKRDSARGRWGEWYQDKKRTWWKRRILEEGSNQMRDLLIYCLCWSGFVSHELDLFSLNILLRINLNGILNVRISWHLFPVSFLRWQHWATYIWQQDC